MAILVAILDFGVTIDTYPIFNSMNEFLDSQNIHVDTKIISLCAILRKIWLSEVSVAVLAAILDFLQNEPHGTICRAVNKDIC